MTKILITGSEGLIGRVLRKQLGAAKVAYLCLDNRLPQNHLGHGDITDARVLQQKISECDGIVHLAAVSRVIWGEKNPKLCWDTNVVATENLLNIALSSHKRPWVIYASSREVYGEQATLPVNESAEQIAVNYYGQSKIAAEQLVSAAQENGLNTAIVRFSNVFGDIYDHPDRVTPAFCHAAAFGNDIYVEGADNVFDFTFVEDVVDGLFKVIVLMIQQQTVPPIHFTTGRPTSLMQLAEIANRLGGNKATIKLRSPRTFDVARFFGDTTRAEQLLDWRPRVSLEEGLNRLIAAFKQSYSHNEKMPII